MAGMAIDLRAGGAGKGIITSEVHTLTHSFFSLLRCLAVTTAVLSLVTAARAQNITGTILGSITDPAGAAVPGVEVRVTHSETGQSTAVRSSDIGHFEAPYLRPGNYQVRVAAPGFRAIVRERVPVQVESRVRLDFALEVGEVSNTVEVTGQIPLLESESSSLGSVVGSKSIQELPLRGRNVFDLVGLSPAVQVNPAVALGQTGSYSSFVASDISINGGRFRTNEYLVDGVSILLPENNNYAFAPTPDGTQEFKVQTSDYGPQFGRSGGGVVNVITRGGSNELHGSISEFFRNDRLTANAFFNNLRNQARPVYHFNLFGAAIGGPVIKNRTFFFGEYQGHRQDTAGAGSVATLPTAAQRSGDFSRTLNSTGQPVVLYDPLTTRAAPAGAGYVREVFPGNVIPAARFDRVSARMLKYVPLPNRPGRTPAELDNYGFTSPSLNNSDYWTVRVDHRFSERHGIFGRFTRTLGLDSAKGPFGTIADNTFGDTNNRVINAAVNDTLTLTPTRVLTWRLGFTRRFEGRGDLHEGETSLVELGFPSSIPAAIQEQIFPAVGMNGYTGWGPPGGERIRRGNDIYTAVVDQTEMHGRHTLIYGGDFRLYNQTPFQGGNPSGAYNFGRDFTQGPDPLRATLTAGDGFGSLLLGYGSGSINL
ncbi:MAG: TonB-dependent receptor, partial [Bryobacterales bacterium]|nr:TonB-dependent receptor [Bryobacterales bacterium]